jgi:hypothetical protein
MVRGRWLPGLNKTRHVLTWIYRAISKTIFSEFQAVFKKYGKVIYGFYIPDENRQKTEE